MSSESLYQLFNSGYGYDALGGISNVEINSINNDMFRPMTISSDILNAFAENAARMKWWNAYAAAA